MLLTKGGDVLLEAVVYLVDVVPLAELPEPQRLVGVVLKALFHGKAYGKVIALVYPAAGDEAVHLGPQGDGAHQRRNKCVQVGILKLGVALCLFRKVGVKVGQVYPLLNKGLVIRPVGVYEGQYAVHGVKVPEPHAVPAVAAPDLRCHGYILRMVKKYVLLPIDYTTQTNEIH